MFSSGSSWRSSKGRGGSMKSADRGLSITTSEDSGCELIVRPSSSGSTGGSTRSKSSRSSKASVSSRGSFRNPFRRRNSSSAKAKRKKEVVAKRVESHPKIPQQQQRPREGKISPPVELRLRLLPRIAEYRERGWINTMEESAFMQLLSDHPVADFESPTDHAAVQVDKALDLIQDHQKKKEKQNKDVVAPPKGNDWVAFQTTDDKGPSQSSSIRTKSSGDSSSTISSIQQGKTFIAYPSELWDAGAIHDTEKLEENFVEMCFFARLGFIQPPSCLRCVHRESMNDQPANTECKRWVAWRRDAKTNLHPHRLEDNVLMVQCHAARSLVNGEQVQGYQWDEENKELKCQGDGHV